MYGVWRLLERMAQAAAGRSGRDPGRLPLVGHYAQAIGELLGWNGVHLHSLRVAVLLHDVGELASPAWEKERWNPHAAIGAAMIAGLDEGAAAIVRSHHEYWDGTGSPDGLRGEAIPAGARILAVADCLAVLPRPEAVEALRRGAGTIFDPIIAALGARADLTPPDARENMDWLQPVAWGAPRDRLWHQLIAGLGNSLSLPDTLAELDARLKKLIDYMALVLWTPQGTGLAAAYVQGEGARWLCALEIPYGSGATGKAAVSRQTVCGDDGTDAPLLSAIAVPLEHEGTLAGVLTLYHSRAAAFAGLDAGLLRGLREKLAASVANALRYESMKKLATQDPATSLPNERALFERLDAELARCRRSGGSLAVLVCGVGGRSAALPAFAAALRRSCREEDFVARMGDRFVLVLTNFRERHLAEKGKQIEQLAGSEVKIGAAFSPGDGAYADDLLAAADARMNQPDGEVV